MPSTIFQRSLLRHIHRGRFAELLLPGDHEVASSKSYKVRILAIKSHETIIVERPDVSVVHHRFQPGQTAELLVADDDVVVADICEISLASTYAASDGAHVESLVLSPRHEAYFVQRRAFFRVSTTAAHVDSITIVPEGYSAGPPVQARMINLSVGGLAVCVQGRPESLRRLQHHTHYRCGLPIAADGNVLELSMTVSHLSPAGHDSLLLGFEFSFSDGLGARQARDQLMRYITWLQRQQLKRASGI